MNEPTPKKGINGVPVSDWEDEGIDEERTRVDEGQSIYEASLNTPKSKPFRRVWEAIRKTLAGETTVGVIGREAKNVLKHFFSWGPVVDTATDAIGDTLKTKTMEKPKSKSKTIIIFGLLFLAGLLQQFGVDLGLELSPDAEWVMVGSGFVGIILRLVTKEPVQMGEVLKLVTRQDKAA